jgi:hypothetical protein
LRDEGFSCSLGVLYGGLGISKLQFLIKKIEIKFLVVNFFNFRSSNPGSGSEIRIRDPDPESGSAIRKKAGSGSGSALNQCGSETLPLTMVLSVLWIRHFGTDLNADPDSRVRSSV